VAEPGVAPSRIGQAWWILRRAVAESKADRIPLIAQALAYSLFLAIPSLALVVLGVFSLVASPDDVERLVDRARDVLPEEAATLLADSLRRSVEATGTGLAMTLVGAALALWATTSAATTLMEGVTTAFKSRDGRSFLRKRVIALVLVVCLLAAALLVVGLLILGPFLERWLGDATGAPTATAWLWWTAQWPILIGALLFLFAVLLYLGPDVSQPRWRYVTPGAAVALVVWLVASGGFAVYSSQFGSYEKTWGTLSAVVVTLVWLWLTSAALLFGAEVNAAARRAAEARSHRVGQDAARVGATGEDARPGSPRDEPATAPRG
jgi:membrane protein